MSTPSLNQLREQCARKQKLKSMLAELHLQREDLAAQAEKQHRILQTEQADVDRLETISLSSLFYSLLGKKDEQLSREQQEAAAARLRYEALLRQLSGVEQQLVSGEAELAGLQDCDARYQAALARTRQELKRAGGPLAQEILEAEESLGTLASRKKELEEAIRAGSRALETAEKVFSSLSSAESWGTVDLIGGGLISDLSKYGHLDDAQRELEKLQRQLLDFRTELADVTIRADFQVGIDGFLQAADYFFDGVFADLIVLDRIQQSLNRIKAVKQQIHTVLDHLDQLQYQTEADLVAGQSRLEELVFRAGAR